MRFKNKHVLVTGAAAGIGKAIVERFASEGAKVSIGDLNLREAQKLATEIQEREGMALAIQCNVCDQSACEAMVAAARGHFGPVDILINCAGGAIVGGKFQSFSECTQEFIKSLIGVNLMGTIYTSRAVVGEMKERRSGKIVNFSSIRALTGDGNCVLYGTSKGAIISFTKSLAIEMGPYGVNVPAVAPGAINSRPGPGSAKNYLNRPGTCDEVAALTAFLASDEAAFITGTTVVIDGGRSCAALSDMPIQLLD